MPKDTPCAGDIGDKPSALARIAALRAMVIDPAATERMRELRELREQCAKADKPDRRRIAAQLRRVERSVRQYADASLIEFALLAIDLADTATALADALRAVDAHVAETGRRHPTFRVWPTCDASARGLHVLACSLNPLCKVPVSET